MTSAGFFGASSEWWRQQTPSHRLNKRNRQRTPENLRPARSCLGCLDSQRGQVASINEPTGALPPRDAGSSRHEGRLDFGGQLAMQIVRLPLVLFGGSLLLSRMAAVSLLPCDFLPFACKKFHSF